jgi:hypothetical protein
MPRPIFSSRSTSDETTQVAAGGGKRLNDIIVETRSEPPTSEDTAIKHSEE